MTWSNTNFTASWTSNDWNGSVSPNLWSAIMLKLTLLSVLQILLFFFYKWRRVASRLKLTFSKFLWFFLGKKVVVFQICDRLIHNTYMFWPSQILGKFCADDVIGIWTHFTHIQNIFRIFRKQKSCSVLNLRSIDV